MTNQEFEKLYNNLNSAQKEAVDTIEGAVMVVAGPGTGKTQVLTLRLANILLKTQINPENILALTFTEAAAFEMRKRLLAIIGHDAYRVEITTFHSFCNNFIKTNQEEFAHIIAAASINEIEQLQIIEGCVNSLPLIILRPLGDTRYYLKPILNAINELKRENVTPELFRKALEESKKELDSVSDLYHEKGPYKGKMKSAYQKSYQDIEKNKELLLVFETYQKKLTEGKKYDYNDMLLEVIKKLTEHPYLLQLLQEKFQYFLIDEHQDTNASQNKIVELLCSYFDNPNLFVVGDEKQAIFRFQGANLENFLYFNKLYPQAKLINLSENYRSTKTILNATHSVILNNPKSTHILSESKSLIKRSLHKEEKIEIVAMNSSDAEYFWIAEKISNILKATSGNEIAILARNNKDLDPLIPILDTYKINYIIESDINILDDLWIQKLIILLRVVSDPIKNKEEYLKKALLLNCFKIHPIDVFKLIYESGKRKKSLWEILGDRSLLKELSIVGLREINDFFALFTDPNMGLIKKAANERPDLVFVDTLNRSGLMKKILEKRDTQEILTRVTRLYDVIKEEMKKNSSFSLVHFLTYIDLLEENNISLKQNTHIVPKDTVRLMTAHRSKGQEFDTVFIINSCDGHWGNSRKRGSVFRIPWEQLGLRLNKELEDEQNVDERRLFYVALTRARKNIFLTYSLNSHDGKEQIPSQFLSEIPKELIKNVDISDFQKNLLEFPEKLLGDFNNSLINTDSLLFSKEYIAEIFRRQGLSVSALNNFIKCPWKYFFNNLIRIPETISDSGLFGNAIHFALNNYIISLKRGNESQELLLKLFKDELLRQPITESDMPNFLKRGENALKDYYKERMFAWSKNIESELEIRGIRISDDIVLNGKIDMVFPVKGDIVDVYDFKTGKPRSRSQIEGLTKSSDGNYKRQLVFYKILLERFRNGFFKMRNGIIEFVEPDEKGVFRHEQFLITKEETEELLQQIIEIANKIITLSFLNTKCSEKQCKYCALRSYVG